MKYVVFFALLALFVSQIWLWMYVAKLEQLVASAADLAKKGSDVAWERAWKAYHMANDLGSALGYNYVEHSAFNEWSKKGGPERG